MRVTVLNYYQFEELLDENSIDDSTVENYKDSTAFVSVLDSVEWFSQPHFENDHANALTLQFDDVTQDGEPSPTVMGGKTKAFSDEQAKKLYEFIKRNEHVEFFVVHCAAGVSRSGAIGTFVNDLYGEPHDRFMQRNRMVKPNPMITRKLNNLLRNDK